MNQILFRRELYIPSTIDGLNCCLNMAYELSKQFDFDFDTSFCLHTVIIEAVENAIMHGNRHNGDSEVRVLIELNANEIFVEVEDKGEGFDLNSIPSPVDGSAIQQEGGRGIFFIKSLSSSCTTIGKGNIIRIKLKR